jgi:hypothetical protein
MWIPERIIWLININDHHFEQMMGQWHHCKFKLAIHAEPVAM